MSTAPSTPAAAAFRPAAALALIGACTSVNTTGASLAGTAWQVVSIAGSATPRSTMYRLEFRDGRIGGRFGCNSFGGSYEVRSRLLVTADIASTLMGCPEPAATHETRGLAVLGQPMRIEWMSDQRVKLSNTAGSIALERIDAAR